MLAATASQISPTTAHLSDPKDGASNHCIWFEAILPLPPLAYAALRVLVQILTLFHVLSKKDSHCKLAAYPYRSAALTTHQLCLKALSSTARTAITSRHFA